MQIEKKYVFCLVLALNLVACTKTEKWSYEINVPANTPFWTAYKIINSAEVQYKNSLVSIKNTSISTAHSRQTYENGFRKDSPIPEKTRNEIIGPCPYIDYKNWKCGGYQMFNGELKDDTVKMFKE